MDSKEASKSYPVNPRGNDKDELKKPEREQKPAIKKKGRYLLAFRHNRSFELHIGRDVYAFGPNQAMEVPERVVKHRDFAESPVRELFTVREV